MVTPHLSRRTRARKRLDSDGTVHVLIDQGTTLCGRKARRMHATNDAVECVECVARTVLNRDGYSDLLDEQEETR